MIDEPTPTTTATDAPPPAPVASDTPPAAPTTTATEPPKPPATPPAVVDVLGEDLNKLYPSLAEMEAAQAQGLKFPVERAWLDAQMAHPTEGQKFRAFVNSMRGLATKEREVTVSQQKAIQTERQTVEQERAALRAERVGLQKDRDALAAIVKTLPTMPKVPAGGEPDPKSPDPKVQEYFAAKYVAKLFEPMTKKLEEFQVADTKAAEEATQAEYRRAQQAFIDRTSDYSTYHPAVLELFKSGEVSTVEAGYHLAKSRALAAAPPPVVKDTGPDFSKMNSTDVTLYALEHPGWKPPADVASRLGRR